MDAEESSNPPWEGKKKKFRGTTQRATLLWSFQSRKVHCFRVALAPHEQPWWLHRRSLLPVKRYPKKILHPFKHTLLMSVAQCFLQLYRRYAASALVTLYSSWNFTLSTHTHRLTTGRRARCTRNNGSASLRWTQRDPTVRCVCISADGDAVRTVFRW